MTRIDRSPRTFVILLLLFMAMLLFLFACDDLPPGVEQEAAPARVLHTTPHWGEVEVLQDTAFHTVCYRYSTSISCVHIPKEER